MAYVTPQDLVDALSEPVYMALFDDATVGIRPSVDTSTGVQSAIKRAHSQVVSYLPRVYDKLPPEVPLGVAAGGDNIPILLKDAELKWATIYAYRRHREYVRTYSAEPGGSLVKEAEALMERIADLVQQIATTDTPPAARAGRSQSATMDDGVRIISSSLGGISNMGDF